MSRITLSLLVVFCVALTCQSQAQTLPPAVPAGPLGDMDGEFLTQYTATTKRIIQGNPPYVEILGSSLILHHAGQTDRQRVLPTIYHSLKDVTHVPFTVYLELAPMVSLQISDTQIGQLQHLTTEIVAAEKALATGEFSQEQLSRQKQILEASNALLQTVIADKHIDREKLDGFAHSVAPLMLRNADEAGCHAVQGTHAQMMKWKTSLSGDEWSHLIAVNKGAHQARYRNAATQYFQWLFQGSSPSWGYPGESTRLFYVESLPKDQTGADSLAAILLDADASRTFFKSEWRLSEDILSDGAARCIAQLPEADRIWHSQ